MDMSLNQELLLTEQRLSNRIWLLDGLSRLLASVLKLTAFFLDSRVSLQDSFLGSWTFLSFLFTPHLRHAVPGFAGDHTTFEVRGLDSSASGEQQRELWCFSHPQLPSR